MKPGEVVPPADAPTITDNPLPVVPPPKKDDKKNYIRGIALFLLIFAAAMFIGLYFGSNKKSSNQQPEQVTSPAVSTQTTTPKVQGTVLVANKDYGNKYANEILPVGDGHYVTTSPKAGYIYACSQYAQSLNPSNGGAGTRGPWFINGNTQIDLNKKVYVQGKVAWQPSLKNTISGAMRTISTNDLPNHVTGTFPIAKSDPAYAYDRNPNSIKSQSLTYQLNSSPAYGDPHCMGGEAGIMLTGAALFSAFDAGGRDAVAWETQDGCGGHPQNSGEYHYHALSTCIKNINVKTVIGFALDGFPITGPVVGTNNILTTSDLDECHGLTSQISLDGKSVTMYHYVMTQDFPYSVSCFRSAAIQPPNPQAASSQLHP